MKRFLLAALMAAVLLPAFSGCGWFTQSGGAAPPAKPDNAKAKVEAPPAEEPAPPTQAPAKAPEPTPAVQPATPTPTPAVQPAKPAAKPAVKPVKLDPCAHGARMKYVIVEAKTGDGPWHAVYLVLERGEAYAVPERFASYWHDGEADVGERLGSGLVQTANTPPNKAPGLPDGWEDWDKLPAMPRFASELPPGMPPDVRSYTDNGTTYIGWFYSAYATKR